jgi:Spy/CpxP family protein refolding chaperone
VRKMLVFVVAIAVLTGFGFVGTRQTANVPVAQATVDEVLKVVRADLQMDRSDIIAKNVTLTSEQAAKFRPVFDKYQKEQNAIMDEQMRGIQRFVDGYANMDDATALALMQAHFDRDTRMNALRQQYLAEFQRVLPIRIAARVMQIDRRLSLVHQMEFASRIPLIH